MIKQSTLFLEGEADNWFLRNRTALEEVEKNSDQGFVEVNWLCQALTPFKGDINSVLEIGCSNGVKLAQLSAFLGAQGQGIDPSELAVEDGNKRFGERIRLRVGTASGLPFESNSFDFVHFGFCLYLLDRNDVLSAMAEANRVLKNGGFVSITDFDPPSRRKSPYHHAKGVFSFKQDYSRLLTESGLYYLVAKHGFSHRQPFFDTNGNERISTSLLFKEIDAC